MTLTPLDHQWLQAQINNALAAAPCDPSTPVTLPRSTVETLACVLDSAPAPTPALASRYHISTDDLRPAVIAEMQRLAAAGVAPSKSRFDVQRQRQLPTAQHICRVLDVRWHELAKDAGLRLSPYARRYAGDTGELEVAAEMADDANVQTSDEDTDEVELQIIRTRTEITERHGVRTIRQYHELR